MSSEPSCQHRRRLSVAVLMSAAFVLVLERQPRTQADLVDQDSIESHINTIWSPSSYTVPMLIAHG